MWGDGWVVPPSIASPSDNLAVGGHWPEGPWKTMSPGEKLAVAQAVAISKAVRGARAAAHMTQKELADIAGVGQRTILRIENGTAWPDIRTAALVLGALGVKDWPTSSD